MTQKLTLLLRSAEEVYGYYLSRFGEDGDGDPDAVGLFAYALVEHDKFNWIAHHRIHHDNTAPSAQEIEDWYGRQPKNYYEKKSSDAIRWYKAFARSLLEDEIEEGKQDAVRDGIVGVVTALKVEALSEVTKVSAATSNIKTETIAEIHKMTSATTNIKTETISEMRQLINSLTGLKAFFTNVVAGVVAAVIVSALALFFYTLHEAHNPDVVEEGKKIITEPPVTHQSMPPATHSNPPP